MATSNHVKVAISGVSKDRVSDFLASSPEYSHWLIRCTPSKKRKSISACVVVAILADEFGVFRAAVHRFFGGSIQVTMLT